MRSTSTVARRTVSAASDPAPGVEGGVSASTSALRRFVEAEPRGQEARGLALGPEDRRPRRAADEADVAAVPGERGGDPGVGADGLARDRRFVDERVVDGVDDQRGAADAGDE